MPKPLHVQALKPAWQSVAVCVLLLVFTAQLVHVARLYSANWDEAHHLCDGYRIWTAHDYRLNAEVPPLVKLAAALPVLPMHLVQPEALGHPQTEEAFLEGRAFVFGNGGDRLLFPARMACMGFSLLLALLLYLASREMFGSFAALLALALFVFDPTVLAHGTLVSTDIASACFIFATVYAFYRYGTAPSAGRLALTGILAGFAMCAKFTGVFVWPFLVLLGVGEGILVRNGALLLRRMGACLTVLVIAVAVIWAFYGFRDAPAPGGLDLSPSLAPYIASVPGRGNAAVLAAVARLHLLPRAFLWGLANTKHTEWEYTSYFFGRMYRHGPALYFPMAFLIKSPLPLLLALAVLFALWSPRRTGQRRELLFLVLPVLLYFALVTSSHMDIGARHLMPIYPFLYVLAGFALALSWQHGRGWAALAAALLLWQVVTSLRVAPDYMAYGNEAWGGPSAVHRYLSDANVDWGQQLKTVKQYLDEHQITDCWFAYFPDGAVQPADYGVHCKRLPTGSSLNWFRLPMEVPPVIRGTVLISDSDLEGVESGDGALNWFNPFRGLKPVATLQHGVYVYRGQFAVPLMSALVDTRDSGDLAQAGHAAQALALAQTAVALAPESATVQLNLADRLAAAHQWPAALLHYRQAALLARTVRPEFQDADTLPRSVAGTSLAEHMETSAR